VFPAITTEHLAIEDTSTLSAQVYDLISNALITDSKA